MAKFIGQMGPMETIKQLRLLSRLAVALHNQKAGKALLLKTTPTYLIEYRELELVPN